MFVFSGQNGGHFLGELGFETAAFMLRPNWWLICWQTSVFCRQNCLCTTLVNPNPHSTSFDNSYLHTFDISALNAHTSPYFYFSWDTFKKLSRCVDYQGWHLAFFRFSHDHVWFLLLNQVSVFTLSLWLLSRTPLLPWISFCHWYPIFSGLISSLDDWQKFWLACFS